MDHVGGHLGASSNFQEMGEEGVAWGLRVRINLLYHLPFFVVGSACGGIGLLGMIWFWYRWQSNYIWISSNIFMPGALSAIQGVIATVITTYAINNSLVFVGPSKWTLIATGGTAVVFLALYAIYHYKLTNLQNKHDEECGMRDAGTHGEGKR